MDDKLTQAKLIHSAIDEIMNNGLHPTPELIGIWIGAWIDRDAMRLHIDHHNDPAQWNDLPLAIMTGYEHPSAYRKVMTQIEPINRPVLTVRSKKNSRITPNFC